MADQKKHQWHFDTNAIHAGQDASQWNSRAVVPPISMATTFQQKAPADHYGYEYSRSGNPTRCCLEACLASLEHTKYALVYASGLAATHNVTHLLNPGDHIVSFDDLYGGTNRLFRNLVVPRGLDVSFVDATDLKKVEAALKPNTKVSRSSQRYSYKTTKKLSSGIKEDNAEITLQMGFA